MPRTTRKPSGTPRPTWTRLTVDTLAIMDDMMTAHQLCDLTGGTLNQISATLHHLQKVEAVECVEGNGKLWWFLTGEDRRTFTQDERVPEEPGTRKRRSSKPRKVPTGSGGAGHEGSP